MGPWWPAPSAALRAAAQHWATWAMQKQELARNLISQHDLLLRNQGRTAEDLIGRYLRGAKSEVTKAEKYEIKKGAFNTAADAIDYLRSRLTGIAGEGNKEIDDVLASKKPLPEQLAEIQAIQTRCNADAANASRDAVDKVMTAMQEILEAEDIGDDPRTWARALLVTFDGSTYVIWGGKRSQIDPTNRAVTLSLGLDPGVTSPIQISRALFDGLPATEPLRVPAVPEAGTPSTWVPGARVGSVLQAQTAGGGSQFYVLLPDGVQKISSFVADLLRRANSYGAAAPRVVTPDVLVHTPQVTSLPVEYYPAGRLNFVDTAADPTTCVSWEKASTDPQARVAVYNGRGLPVPPSMDSRIVRLVRDDRAPASVVATQVLVLPGAANFVTSTSGVITAESRESLFWVSGNGVRFGIANDEATLRALGLDPGAAVQAPWPLLRTFAAGPALSRDAALLARDTVPTLGQVAIVTTTAKAGA